MDLVLDRTDQAFLYKLARKKSRYLLLVLDLFPTKTSRKKLLEQPLCVSDSLQSLSCVDVEGACFDRVMSRKEEACVQKQESQKSCSVEMLVIVLRIFPTSYLKKQQVCDHRIFNHKFQILGYYDGSTPVSSDNRVLKNVENPTVCRGSSPVMEGVKVE